MEPLCTISKDDFLRLNELALQEGPAAKQNLSNLLQELASNTRSQQLAGCERGVLVLTGRALPKTSGYAGVECVLDFPAELFHPVEQATACLNLLQRIERGELVNGPKPRYTRDEIQRRLSHLLVDFPILMDGRVIYGVTSPVEDWATMACALAETSFASLPSPAHGFSERELRLFASRSCVKSGLIRPNPQSNSKASSLRNKTPLQVADTNGVAPGIFGATRGAFLTSLLRLSHYARVMTGRAVLQVSAHDAKQGDALYKSLAKVFWDVAANDGSLSGVTHAEFGAVMKLPSPFRKPAADEANDPEFDHTIATAGVRASDYAPNALQYQLAVTIDAGLFGVHHANTIPKLVHIYNEEAMFTRTAGAVDLLVSVGTHESHAAAAKWLGTVSVGVTRMWGATAGPACTHEGALGFLSGIGQFGAEVSLTGCTDTAPVGAPTPVQQRAASVQRTWESAISVHETLKTMQGVIERNQNAEVDIPTPRPRSLRQRV